MMGRNGGRGGKVISLILRITYNLFSEKNKDEIFL